MGYVQPASAPHSPISPDRNSGACPAFSVTRAGSQRASTPPLQQAHGDRVLRVGPAICSLSQASAPLGHGRTRDLRVSQSSRDRGTRLRVHAEPGSSRAALSLSPHTVPRHGADTRTYSGEAWSTFASGAFGERGTINSFAHAGSRPSMRESNVREWPPPVRVHRTSSKGH